METEGRQRPMCKTHSVEQAPQTIQEFPSNTTVSGWLCRALREAGDGSAAGPVGDALDGDRTPDHPRPRPRNGFRVGLLCVRHYVAAMPSTGVQHSARCSMNISDWKSHAL